MKREYKLPIRQSLLFFNSYLKFSNQLAEEGIEDTIRISTGEISKKNAKSILKCVMHVSGDDDLVERLEKQLRADYVPIE